MSRADKIIRGFAVAALLAVVVVGNAVARDASFVDPSASGAGSSDEAVKVDPKADIEVGETAVNVAKRTSIFFVNQTNVPVKIEKIVVNGDSSVAAEASANDCTKQGSIDASSRCSVEISVTPTTPGPWNVDVLMTHNGAGRITRAHLSGKTSGVVAENKGSGLSVTAKETKPIDFGDIVIGSGKTVRSTLMVNDSSDPITIYAIDVIEADNGLQRLDQGCSVDMELAPGSSCPVTLLWVPKNDGPISTDLIIRHSGRLGFAVIPVRGVAKGDGTTTVGAKDKTAAPAQSKTDVPPPPSAHDLEKEMAGHVEPVAASSLGNVSAAPVASGKPGSDGGVHVIGTIGNRALILKASGDTAIVPTGDTFDYNGKTAKLVAVNARSIDVSIDGKTRTMSLEAVSSLVDQAARQSADENAGQQKSSAAGGKK